MNAEPRSFIALSGGIGGAKLTLGLNHVLAPGELTVIANTGDDFEHMGLYISPDIDTLSYTLAGINNNTAGWGRQDETWSFMEAASDLGLPTWFRLGDRDLALHVYRTTRLGELATLSTVTEEINARFGITSRVVPMSDAPVRTMLVTNIGLLPFQEYFVKHRCAPTVSAIRYMGADTADPAPACLPLLADRNLHGVIICPSNPFLSIGPILAVPRLLAAIKALTKPVIIVSPMIQGKSLKGPTGKISSELGLDSSVTGIAEWYRDIADGVVIDTLDSEYSERIRETGMAVYETGIVMNTLQDRIRLATEVIEFSDSLLHEAGT